MGHTVYEVERFSSTLSGGVLLPSQVLLSLFSLPSTHKSHDLGNRSRFLVDKYVCKTWLVHFVDSITITENHFIWY